MPNVRLIHAIITGNYLTVDAVEVSFLLWMGSTKASFMSYDLFLQLIIACIVVFNFSATNRTRWFFVLVKAADTNICVFTLWTAHYWSIDHFKTDDAMWGCLYKIFWKIAVKLWLCVFLRFLNFFSSPRCINYDIIRVLRLSVACLFFDLWLLHFLLNF